MVICLEQGADLHMAQLISLPLTVSCFSKIQIGFTFLVPAHPGSPGQRAVKRLCVVCVCESGRSERGVEARTYLVSQIRAFRPKGPRNFSEKGIAQIRVSHTRKQYALVPSVLVKMAHRIVSYHISRRPIVAPRYSTGYPPSVLR